MTCIVGIVSDGVVHIGCDSMGSNGHDFTLYPRNKIFKKSDRFMFGICGSYSVMDTMQHLFDPPELGEKHNTTEYMRKKFIPALRTCLETAGLIKTSNGVKTFGSFFLVGFDGVLFLVQNDFSVLELPEMGGATGSGQEGATAVLFDYHRHRSSGKAIDKLRAALEASSACVVSVGGELHFDSVKKVSFNYGDKS